MTDNLQCFGQFCLCSFQIPDASVDLKFVHEPSNLDAEAEIGGKIRIEHIMDSKRIFFVARHHSEIRIGTIVNVYSQLSIEGQHCMFSD